MSARESSRDQKPDPVVIGFVEKNSRERIRIALDSYRDHRYIDVRIFAYTEAGDKATKQGITIRPDRVADLRKLLDRAEAAARQAGWLADAN